LAKTSLGVDVLTAAKERIRWVVDNFPKIYVSFSGGKDSTVMLHLVMDAAIKQRRKVGVLFVDLEGQYKLTIDHIQDCYNLYSDHIEPYWVALPLNLRNAVSVYEPQWMCFDPDRKTDWVREPPSMAITSESYFPFFHRRMEFEEFVPAFGHWYAQDKPCACFVGIRADESLNRFRTIAGHGTKLDGRKWTNYVGETLYNIYPIYDWRTEDIWTYHGKTGKVYNQLYDLMYKAGLTIHQQRICQPYGDDQRKGLWLFHLIEPETWARIVARVNGANQGSLYAQESGNILGRIHINKPEGHTWKSFAYLLLESMPPVTREHYKDKIAVFLRWWQTKGNFGSSYGIDIPDEVDSKLEAGHDAPSWRRICKALLRNDYWCKGLSFSQHKSEAYEKYIKLMRKRRAQWKII
jgi:predicted phosphoadenosine phosphosulfate sulfurtransferase